MLSLKEIALAYIIGILWGLYLELDTLIITSIFLCFYMLMFIKKFHYEILFLSIVSILGCLYIDVKIKDFDSKYIDGTNVNLNAVIISKGIENEYTYKYNCESECGDKFIVYFKKNNFCDMKIGSLVKIEGKFNLPDVARNKGRF